MNPDFVAIARELRAVDARFLIVGAFAVALHSRPRATGDLDIWIDPSPKNAQQVYDALSAFGAPMTGITPRDLATPGLVYQIGIPPRRIDILTSLTGITFEEAWPGRVAGSIGEVSCGFIGREALIRNKRALGRPRDLADLDALGERA